MNRCTSHLPRTLSCAFLRVFCRALFVLAAAPPLAMLPAHAQSTEFKPALRQFPPAALRGELVVTTPPAITLDGKADQLSPGARIHGANNLLVMSGALVNQKLAVNYLRESAGSLHEIWILNREEINQKRPNSKSSWFGFGSNGYESPATAKSP
ncbi:MAG: hypothetical protein ABIQ90_05865 [Polaromonas sp.]